MNNRWTLYVENTGKIKTAEVSVKPLTLFVGDNNSGKSYLMYLLYTLVNARFLHQALTACKGTSEYGRCAEWIESFLAESQQGPVTRTLDDDNLSIFEKLLNRTITNNLPLLAALAFNTEIPIGAIQITLPRAGQPADLTLSRLDHKGFSTLEYSGWRGKSTILVPDSSPRGENMTSVFLFLEHTLECILKNGIAGFSPNDSVFLPASRTGFLLTAKSLMSDSLSRTYDIESRMTGGRLTRPCSDFLKMLVSLTADSDQKTFNGIVRLIEQEMLHGKISLSAGTPFSDANYQPDGMDNGIPMFLSSGVVTELAPLLLTLKYHEPFQVLFVEEPEMGMHPALQQLMARVLVQLRNHPLSVFITTHSDIILQHINNMIKLGNLSENRRRQLMKHYGLTEKDLLSAADVAMYQFDVDNTTGTSTIHSLEYNEYGFVVPTFNNALAGMLERSRDFERDEVSGDDDE